MTERQQEIDAYRRLQNLSELERKAKKAMRRHALHGTVTMEEFDYELATVMSVWGNAMCDAAFAGDGFGECASDSKEK